MHFTPNPNDPLLNPSVWFGSFELREPITSLTDFLIALTSFSIIIIFSRYKGKKTENFDLYKLYFWCSVIGMTCAAWLGHGLQAYISPSWKMIGWIMSALGLLFLIFASINQLESKLGEKGMKIFKTIIVIKFVLLVSLIINPSTSSFKLIQINSTIDIIALTLPLQFLNYRWNKSRGSLKIVIALIYGIIPGMIYNFQIGYNKWLNHHDISHILIAFFMFLMFRGAFDLSTNKSGSTNV